MAQQNLGHKYLMGDGVKQDDVSAYVWWNIAETNGGQDAKTNKAIVAERMTPAQIVTAEELVKEMVKKNPKLLNKK
ncbi:hypothetical protein OAL58_08990 [Verrucomicrobia bacterium]|nr:hypothetical protein [Verrucomicrobiota bacterium]